MTTLLVRAAVPAEASTITELACRSKAHWGYTEEFIDHVRTQLTTRPEDVRDGRVVVAERDSTLLGYYKLSGTPPDGELADLFIDPAAIGTGVGRVLWEHAVRTARQLGFDHLDLESDPHAEAFYLRMGADRVGSREVAPDRALPLMRIRLDDRDAPRGPGAGNARPA